MTIIKVILVALVSIGLVLSPVAWQTVLRAMRKEGINIVAVHQHMADEQPRILFLHYWGKGKASAVAQ